MIWVIGLLYYVYRHPWHEVCFVLYEDSISTISPSLSITTLPHDFLTKANMSMSHNLYNILYILWCTGIVRHMQKDCSMNPLKCSSPSLPILLNEVMLCFDLLDYHSIPYYPIRSPICPFLILSLCIVWYLIVLSCHMFIICTYWLSCAHLYLNDRKSFLFAVSKAC